MVQPFSTFFYWRVCGRSVVTTSRVVVESLDIKYGIHGTLDITHGIHGTQDIKYGIHGTLDITYQT